MSAEARSEPTNIPMWSAWAMFSLTALFYFYEFLLRVIPSVMLDEIMLDYSINADQAGVLEASFYYAYAPLQLFAGPLIDEYGPSRIFPLAIVCCLIGSLLSVIKVSFALLIFARLLIGFGSGFAFVIVLKTANDWLPQRYYPFLSGLTTALGMLGGIVAQEYIPTFARYGDSYMYISSAVFALLLIVGSLLVMKDKEKHHDDSVSYKLIIYDIYSVICQPQTLVISLVGCLLFSPIQVFAFWAKKFFISGLYLDPESAAHAVEMLYWGVAIGGPLFGWIAGMLNNKKQLLCLGSLLSCVLMLVLIYYNFLFAAPLAYHYVALLMLGTGFFMSTQSLIFVFAKDIISSHLAATSIATVNMVVSLSAFLQPIIGYMLEWHHRTPGLASIYRLEDWQYALWPIPLFLGLSALISLLLKEKKLSYNEPVQLTLIK